MKDAPGDIRARLNDSDLLMQLPLAFWASRGAAGDYRVVLWNDAAAKMYGIAAADAIGERFTSLFVADEARAQAEADADAVIDSGRHPVNTIAVDHRPDDGRALILLTNVFRLEVGGDRLHAEISVDLTGSDELSRYIDDDARQLIFTSDQRTFDFLLANQRRVQQHRHLERVSSMAHEVKSELAVILRSLQTVASVEGRSALLDACNRARDYVETLLIHARAAVTDGNDPDPTARAVPFVPDEIIGRVRMRYSNTSSRLEWVPSPQNPHAVVIGNERDFELALSNLLSNAVRHGENGSTIRIDSHLVPPRARSRGYLRVVVSNRPRRRLGAVARSLDDSLTESLNAQKRYGLSVVRLLASAAGGSFDVKVDGVFVIATLDWPVSGVPR
jgi:PAS domain S-box-containing protein